MSLTQQSYRQIRETLLSDHRAFGERFSIKTLSEHLGIGRSPVRDAVNRLAAEGLLESVAKSGIVVHNVSYDELQDIVGLREAIEPYASGLACQRMDYVLRRRLRAICMDMRRLARQVLESDFGDDGLNRALQRADWRFHSSILEASGNRKMQRIAEDHHLLLRKVRYPSLRTEQHLALTLLEHWRICRAIGKGDADAARRWMLRHARRGGNAVLESWREAKEGRNG